MSALRETALAAIAVQLATADGSATVERERREPVELSADMAPMLVLTGGDLAADPAAEFGATHYQLEFVVTGTLAATDGLALSQAMSLLHAKVVSVLGNWQPAESGLGEVSEVSAEFRAYDIEESDIPAGEFTARFTILLIGPLLTS